MVNKNVLLPTHGETTVRIMKKHLKLSNRLSAPSWTEAQATKNEPRSPHRPGEPAINGSVELKTILVPVDFSPGALHALDFAVSLARRLGSSIMLVHVMDSIYVSGRFGSRRLRSLRAEAHEESKRLLAALAKCRVRPHVPVQHRLLSGLPGAKIVEMSLKTGADLIVMGSEGRIGVKRFLIGSMAERVIRDAHCPVLVVRDRFHREPESRP